MERGRGKGALSAGLGLAKKGLSAGQFADHPILTPTQNLGHVCRPLRTTMAAENSTPLTLAFLGLTIGMYTFFYGVRTPSALPDNRHFRNPTTFFHSCGLC